MASSLAAVTRSFPSCQHHQPVGDSTLAGGMNASSSQEEEELRVQMIGTGMKEAERRDRHCSLGARGSLRLVEHPAAAVVWKMEGGC